MTDAAADGVDEKPYESVKLLAEGRRLAGEIARGTGLHIHESILATLRAWSRVPKRAREEIRSTLLAEREARDRRRVS